MKKIFKKIFWLLPVFSLFIFSACSMQTAKNTKGGLEVASTIFPLYDLVNQIGGEKINNQLIVPSGSSPHTFEATPGLIKDLQEAKIIFTIGSGLDTWTSDLTSSLESVELVTVDKNISLKEFEVSEEHEHEHEGAEEHEEDEEHHHEGIDPHYWLSPQNAIQMASNIKTELVRLDAKNAEYYQNNLDAFLNQMATKDKEWKEKLSQLNNKKIAVFHDAWNYFADYFGLDIVASFEPFPGKSPSPEYLVDLQAEIKEHQIKAMFVEPQLSRTALESLAADMNVKIGVMDPLGGVSGRNDYFSLIDFNIQSLLDNQN